MIKLGITGGIGSGKSTVATLLQIYGIPVYNADEKTKKLNNSSPIIREQLIKYFGEELYNNKELNKKKFAEIIFNDANKLSLANSIIHPEVLKDFTNWCKEHSEQPIIGLEAAILFESNFHIYLDKVVTVYSPLELRVERVCKRDNVTPDKVKNRIKHQMPETEKIDLSDFVIINDNKHSLIDQAEKLIKEIKPTH